MCYTTRLAVNKQTDIAVSSTLLYLMLASVRPLPTLVSGDFQFAGSVNATVLKGAPTFYDTRLVHALGACTPEVCVTSVVARPWHVA